MNQDAIQYVAFELIRIDDFQNCRRTITDIGEIAASIKTTGLLHPLTVRKVGEDDYVLRAGFRRYAALEKLNLTEVGFEVVPVLILEGPEKDDSIINLGENILQKSLSWLQVADAVARLFDEGHPVQELADKFGKSSSWVSTRIIISRRLSADVLAAVEGEYINLTEALQLSGLAKEEQDAKIEEMLDSPSNYQKMREELRAKRDPRPGIKAIRLQLKELRAYDRPEDAEHRAGVIAALEWAAGTNTVVSNMYHPAASE